MGERVLMKGNEAMSEAAKAVDELARQANVLQNLIVELRNDAGKVG